MLCSYSITAFVLVPKNCIMLCSYSISGIIHVPKKWIMLCSYSILVIVIFRVLKNCITLCSHSISVIVFVPCSKEGNHCVPIPSWVSSMFQRSVSCCIPFVFHLGYIPCSKEVYHAVFQFHLGYIPCSKKVHYAVFQFQNFTYGNPQALEFFSPGYPRHRIHNKNKMLLQESIRRIVLADSDIQRTLFELQY